MKTKLTIAFVLIFLSGCATAYKPIGFTGGYSDTQLGDNIFRVSFRGNGYTSSERATDFSLLRSAELALDHGFKYFVIVKSGERTKTSLHTAPATMYTGKSIYTISKPRATSTIFCYKDKPDVNGVVFDAKFITRSIRQKYGLKK